MKQCIVVGSGPVKSLSVFEEYDAKNAFVICADGGLDTALAAKVKPNVVIGEFDSAKSSPPANTETIRLLREKDDTDMISAVKEGLRRGYNDFVLLGAMGGRFDHMYANICTLQYILSKGGRGLMADKDEKIFLMPGGRLHLRGMRGNTASVYPFGCANATVSYTGMKYPLNEEVLTIPEPRGTSNIIDSDDATITVLSGQILIYVINADAVK